MNHLFVSVHKGTPEPTQTEEAEVDDQNVKGFVVGICLALLVGVFASLAVDTFFGRDDGIESPLRGS